jgi:hypothetical protein
VRRLLALALLGITASAGAAVAPVKAHVVTDNNASCDIGTYAAATLLLPYFEVDYKSPATTAVNTIFTVINTSRVPQIARVTIWTDLGFPASWFNIFLTGYDVQTISMYEIIARGNYPQTTSEIPPGVLSAENASNPNFHDQIWCDRSGGTLPPSMTERLQQILTTGVRDSECRVGTTHQNAVGYITIDVVNSCAADGPTTPEYWKEVLLFDNVLTGDYERINPNPTTGNYAGGNPLVHIRAVPEGGLAGSTAGTKVPLPYTFYDRYTPPDLRKADRRQPLPSVFAARYIEGGPTGFQTRFIVWREGITGATREECAYAKNEKLPVGQVVRFDEHENPTTVAAPLTLASTSVTASTAPVFPPMTGDDVGGWFWISLDNGNGKTAQPVYSAPRPSQNWVVVSMYAEGRYAVDFDATWLANGCTTAAPATP